MEGCGIIKCMSLHTSTFIYKVGKNKTTKKNQKVAVEFHDYL